MGLRGPAPKPSELRRLEGNPARRPLPAKEPKYHSGLPSRPKRLSAAAKPIWDELVEEMAGAAILRRVDTRALACLCEDEAIIEEAYSGFWATINSLKQRAKAEGKTLPGGALMGLLTMQGGRLALTAINNVAARTMLERREFGLTPSSRTRIEMIDGATAIDSLEMALCG